MTTPYNPDLPDLSFIDVGELAVEYMSELNDPPRVVKQLASGVAVHFGSESLFVPGNDYRALNDVLHRKITELACTYIAWNHAVEQAERKTVS